MNGGLLFWGGWFFAGENQAEFVIPLASVDVNIPRTRHSLYLVYTALSRGPGRCLPGSLGRNACSFNKTGTCGRGNLQHFGYLGHKDPNTRKKPEYTAP